MSIITLLTDFGTTDEYVGVMKGAILSVNPSAMIVDITHHVDPQDVIEATYLALSSYLYFPKGTVHLIVVDPGVGTDRAILAVKINGHILIAPDNGILTLVTDDQKVESVIRVENSEYFLESVSQTFHGRDIFAPVAAHITNGVDISRLGTPMNPDDMVRLDIHKPYISDTGEIVGSIISIDRFGNLITNIGLKNIEMLCGKDAPRIRIGRNIILGLSQSYESAEPHRPLAIIGSRGYLEIALNCGSAENFFDVEKGTIVRVSASARGKG